MMKYTEELYRRTFPKNFTEESNEELYRTFIPKIVFYRGTLPKNHNEEIDQRVCIR